MRNPQATPLAKLDSPHPIAPLLQSFPTQLTPTLAISQVLYSPQNILQKCVGEVLP